MVTLIFIILREKHVKIDMSYSPVSLGCKMLPPWLTRNAASPYAVALNATFLLPHYTVASLATGVPDAHSCTGLYSERHRAARITQVLGAQVGGSSHYWILLVGLGDPAAPTHSQTSSKSLFSPTESRTVFFSAAHFQLLSPIQGVSTRKCD